MAANRLSAGGEARLREILDRYWNAFQHGLCVDAPARIEPLAVTVKPKAEVVEARRRVYSPIKTTWLATYIGTLARSG